MNNKDAGCICQKCGFKFKVDFNVSDSLWDRIHGDYNLLCGMCMTLLIEGLNQFDYFDIVKLDTYNE